MLVLVILLIFNVTLDFLLSCCHHNHCHLSADFLIYNRKTI
uniref:Uncharacterized protein n=1 Tax=Rhizophora mucronata TaxID=61149 RepID=A0A2P2QZS0_RHIMU